MIIRFIYQQSKLKFSLFYAGIFLLINIHSITTTTINNNNNDNNINGN